MDLNEKVNFLFNKSRDLAVTNLHTSFPRHIYGESKQYVIGEEIFIDKIPSDLSWNIIPFPNDDQNEFEKYGLKEDDFYNRYDSKGVLIETFRTGFKVGIEKDISNVLLKVHKLKLQKVPGSIDAYTFINSKNERFLSKAMPQFYSIKKDISHNIFSVPFNIKIYKQSVLDKYVNDGGYIENNFIKNDEFILDSGIFIFGNHKDIENENIYVDIVIYIGELGVTNIKLKGEKGDIGPSGGEKGKR